MAKKYIKSQWQKNLFESLSYISLIVRETCIFLHIILKPLVVVSSIFTIFLIRFTQSQTGTNRLVMEIIVAILSSVVGGLITHFSIEYTGNTFLVKRSNSAIRNLQLIKFKIKNISERITQLKKPSNNRDFGEVENLVENVHKDILNSISDWGDVNPKSEAITDFYEMVSARETEIKRLNKEKAELEIQKQSVAQDKKTEIARLEREIKEKDKKISKSFDQISDLNLSNIGIVSGSALSTPTTPSGVTISGMFTSRTCKKCGKQFYPTGIESEYFPDVCESCR